MKKKYSFPEPSCQYGCEHFRKVGGSLNETRYCMNTKSRAGKRFKRTDPLFKIPKWCPKRIKPVCRIYGLANEMSEWMERENRMNFCPEKSGYISTLERHYKFRLELPLGMTAMAFFEAAGNEPVEDILRGAGLQLGEIIEIDDGLKPYYFYYFSQSTLVPVLLLDRTRVKT